MEEKSEIFPCRAFLSCVVDEVFIYQVFVYNGLSNGCSIKKIRSMIPLEEHFKKSWNAKSIDFQFHNHKFSQKVILDFHVTTATDIFMKEVINSSLRRSLWRKIMETLKAVILTIPAKVFLFTILPYLQDPLWHKYFIVLFIDTSNRPEVFLKSLKN